MVVLLVIIFAFVTATLLSNLPLPMIIVCSILYSIAGSAVIAMTQFQ